MSGSEDTETVQRTAVKNVTVKKRTAVTDWFFTLMCINIPIAGWIYLLYLAFVKKDADRRNFARAYLFYKLIFLIAGLMIVVILAIAALNLLEELLAYMQML